MELAQNLVESGAKLPDFFRLRPKSSPIRPKRRSSSPRTWPNPDQLWPADVSRLVHDSSRPPLAHDPANTISAHAETTCAFGQRTCSGRAQADTIAASGQRAASLRASMRAWRDILVALKAEQDQERCLLIADQRLQQADLGCVRGPALRHLAKKGIPARGLLE